MANFLLEIKPGKLNEFIKVCEVEELENTRYEAAKLSKFDNIEGPVSVTFYIGDDDLRDLYNLNDRSWNWYKQFPISFLSNKHGIYGTYVIPLRILKILMESCRFNLNVHNSGYFRLKL